MYCLISLLAATVAFAINKGLRNADEGNSVFINVRTWNVWLKNYKKNAIEKRRLNQHTEYELYKNTQKLISKTIIYFSIKSF